MFENFKKITFIFIAFYCSIFASVDLTSEHNINWWGLGGKYSESPALGFMYITFATFLAILWFAIKKPLAQFLKSRSEKIKHEIETAKTAKEEAIKRAKQYENRLLELDKEIKKMQEDFRIQGEKEKERIEKNTRILTVQINDAAKHAIDLYTEEKLAKLREEVVRLAMSLAQDKIQSMKLSDVQKDLQEDLKADLKNLVL